MIYFDYNAAAPYSPSVREYLQTRMPEDWGNPSSMYPQAQALEQRIRKCKHLAAERLNCPPGHLFWTSGGTESINTVLSLEALRLSRLSGFITSSLEHHASLKKLEYLSQSQTERGPQAKILIAEHSGQGEIMLDSLEEDCSKNPRSMLSFLSANNETGVRADIKSISKIARKYNCLVHADAVQSLGKEPVDLEAWDVDFASFSGHKIGALKGSGLLYARKPFAPLMFGGGQERGLRPGTYNLPAIWSFQLALQDIDLHRQNFHVQSLRDYFESRLKQMFAHGAETSRDIDLSGGAPKILRKTDRKTESPVFKVNCDQAPRLSNTSNIYCGDGVSGQAVLLHLARKGICVSTGSACHAGSPEPSHVIANLRSGRRAPQKPSHVMAELALFNNSGSHRDFANSCLRVSFGPSNTRREVDFLLQSIEEFYSPEKGPQLSPAAAGL